MTTKSLGACTACRARKVKCTPGTPRCVRCVARGIQDCSYGLVKKKRGIGTTLRMGQACIPCRQRKARCDAKQPCTTCVNGDRGDACTYKPRQQSNTNAPSVSRGGMSGPQSGCTLPSQTSTDGSSEPPIRSPAPDLPLLTLSSSSESASSLSLSPSPAPRKLPSTPTVQLPPELLPHIYDGILLDPSSETSVVQKTHGTAERFPRSTVSYFTILPSIHFQTIRRPLRVPLSLIPPEHTQVSCIAGSDLDMSFRLRSLCRINKLGLYFGTEKWEALLRGDVSNNVVDRYFVHGFQAIGMHLCGPPGESPVIVQLQARYAQMAWESLVKVYGTDDQKLEAQALLLLIHAFVIMGFTTPAQLYLLKMCKAINKANLQLLPVHGRPGELSEQVREDTVILSQAIYLENYFYLTLGGSAPMMTARIEREFRLDLQRAYPLLFRMCPLTMRTQSILLIKDTILVLNSHSTDDPEKINSRRESCHQLVFALNKFSNTLIEDLQRFIGLKDSDGVGTIWTCCVICLAHLAALSHLLSQMEPTLRGSMGGLCDLTLGKLGNLSYEVHIEEYSHFDILTGISWKRALDTINTRIESRSNAESELLCRWRRIIEKAFADFQANIPEYGPTPLASLALSVDGRTEDSSFPNMLLPTEREPYGL